MFDDPKKYLNDLQTKLRQEKYEEELEKLVESPDDFDLDEILGEDAPRPGSGYQQPGQGEEFPIRNRANGYGTRPFPGQNSGPYEQDWRFSREDPGARQDGYIHRPLPGWQDESWQNPRQTPRQSESPRQGVPDRQRPAQRREPPLREDLWPDENGQYTSQRPAAQNRRQPPREDLWPEEDGQYTPQRPAAQNRRRQAPDWEEPEELPQARPPKTRRAKRADRKDQARKAAAEAAPAFDESRAVLDEKPPKKGVGGLWLLFLLEIAGILAIVLWWVRWLL